MPLLGGAVFSSLGGRGAALWWTDGTLAGTRRLTDVPLAGEDGQLEDLAQLGDKVVFSSYTGDEDFPRPWVTDGRPGGTHPLLGSETGTASSWPSNFVALGSSVFFRISPLSGSSIWRSTGDAASTGALTDSSLPDFGGKGLAAAGGKVFFWHDAQGQGVQLWSVDGSSPATVLTHFEADLYVNFLQDLVPWGGKIYFFLPLRSGPTEVWSSDGTPAGTVKAFELPGAPSFVGALTAAGASLYFLMSGSIVGGNDVWSSDGTAAGTHEVATGGTYLGRAPQFTAVGDLVFFSDGGVWATDGTAAGTVRVYDGSHGGPASSLTSWRGALYFLAENASELWRSDGTPAGTVRVATLGPGSTLDVPDTGFMVATADRLFLLADDGVHGQEPWTSDGTASGTLLLRDVNPGVASSSPAGLTVAGDRVFFSADDGVHGNEPWVSDGTPAGTRLAADIAPEALSSNPTGFTVAGDRLYFAADDGLHGQELWALPLSGQTGCQATAAALCLTGGRFRVEAEWRDFQGNIGQGQTLSLTGDTGAFWFFSPANVEVVIKVIDGRSLNQAFWVFYGALSSVDYTLTVTDTLTGLSRRYSNPAGQLASIADTNAFGPLGAFGAPQTPASSKPARATRIAARAEAAAAACTPTAARLCLSGDRFAVKASWQDFQGHTGRATAVQLTGDTGYFWFFDPANVEVITKVLDGRAVNGKFWVFYGALSNVEYTLTVTDTQTGAVKVYTNPIGHLASVADTAAF